MLQGPPLGLLGAEAPAPQIPTHRGAGQPPAIAPANQLGDRLPSPQKPCQAQLIRGRLPHQRNDLLLLVFGEGRLLTGSAAAALLRKPIPATCSIAFDPAVHRIAVHSEQPRGLRLVQAVQHRLDGPVTQRGLCRSRQ